MMGGAKASSMESTFQKTERRKDMKRLHKKGQATFIIILTMIFMTMTIVSAGAEEMIFKTKGNKKIKIGVIDLISSIEVAGLFNKAHEASAKKRGWDIQIFDLKDNVPESATIMENMISAGYDGIIIHWTDLKACANQIKKAADKGIAVISCACRGEEIPRSHRRFCRV